MTLIGLIKDVQQDLIRDEGIVLHAYQDHLGYTTIGVGRMIDERRGGSISKEEAMYLLENDILAVRGKLQDKLSYWHGLNDVRRRALINMGFQLGVAGLMNFKRMHKALENRDYREASVEALDSKWAMQTPERASRIARMIEVGE